MVRTFHQLRRLTSCGPVNPRSFNLHSHRRQHIIRSQVAHTPIREIRCVLSRNAAMLQIRTLLRRCRLYTSSTCGHRNRLHACVPQQLLDRTADTATVHRISIQVPKNHKGSISCQTTRDTGIVPDPAVSTRCQVILPQPNLIMIPPAISILSTIKCRRRRMTGQHMQLAPSILTGMSQWLFDDRRNCCRSPAEYQPC